MFPDGVASIFLRGSYHGVGFKHLDPATDGTTIIEGPGQESGFKRDRSWPLDPMISSFLIWNGIGRAYTKCLLTKGQDRLVAISAIAKQFQPLFEDEYIAGLWKRHLAQHLLWYVFYPRTLNLPTTNSEDYIAPSWSWTSVNGPVIPYARIARHDKPVMIEILKVRVETVTADKMGQVSGGHIKVRGWLKQFSPPELDHHSEDDNDVRMWMFQDPGIDYCFVFPDKLPLPTDLKWYCLPVLETAEEHKKEEKEKGLHRSIHGLCLLETEKKDEYRRVGSFRTSLDTYKPFKRPTYPFQAPQIREEDDIRRLSVPEVQAKSPAAERATGMKINRKTTSSATRKRQLIPFFSRKGQDEESQTIEGQESASGRREWWRFGRQRQPWVERVITIV
jgi:hypothetical protein